MQFNDLLAMAGLDPKEVAVMLHTPSQAFQKQVLMALADDAPDLFEFYHDNHQRNAEATLKNRKFAGSFIVGEASESRFVGLYAVEGWQFQTAAELDGSPERKELMQRFRNPSFTDLANRAGSLGREVFTLNPMQHLSDLKGRLIVLRAPGRAYMRLAEKCDLQIIEVQRDARFAPPPPEWDAFAVLGNEIESLPKAWKAKLDQWRGIYLIIDQTRGDRYVGSAYGETNLLGRWQNHTAGKYGVTVELAKLESKNSRFSILELVSPIAAPELVIKLENNWKHRLDTRTWGLNKN
jgi:hypothetical protein